MSAPKKSKPAIENEEPKKGRKGKPPAADKPKGRKRGHGRAGELPGLSGEASPPPPDAAAKGRSRRRKAQGEEPPAMPPNPDQLAIAGTDAPAVAIEGETSGAGDDTTAAAPAPGPEVSGERPDLAAGGDEIDLTGKISGAHNEGPLPGVTKLYADEQPGVTLSGGDVPTATTGDKVRRVKAENASAMGLQLTEDQIRRANEHGAVYARMGTGPYFYKAEGEPEAAWHKQAPTLYEVEKSRGSRYQPRNGARGHAGSLSVGQALAAVEAGSELASAVEDAFDLPAAEALPRLRQSLDAARAAGL